MGDAHGDAHAGCDRMDITRLGITQDIGVVAVIDTKGLLLGISDNHASYKGVTRAVTADELEEVFIGDVFHERIAHAIRRDIEQYHSQGLTRTYLCDGIAESFQTYVSISRQRHGDIVVEVEAFAVDSDTRRDILDLSNTIDQLTSHDTQETTAKELCNSLFEDSGYDRAMVYKFLDDMSGEVIHEAKDEKKVPSSFLGLRFPAADIPLPARKAYTVNPVRFIADVGHCSRRLLSKRPLALTKSYLRGCAVPHKAYLQSMGVTSSLSLAISDEDGGLWGLVTMHSYSSKVIPKIENRIAYSMLASVVSGHTQHIAKAERVANDIKVTRCVSCIDTSKPMGVFLVENEQELLDVFRVDAVSLFSSYGNSPTTVGAYGVTSMQEVVSTEESISYGELQSPPRSYVCLRALGYTFVLTRASDVCRDILWAGDPSEVHVSDLSPSTTMPRKSFATYVQHVSTTPPPFTRHDKAMFETALQLLVPKVHQIRLGQVQREMEKALNDSQTVRTKSDENYSFFASMSHELRTPLHSVMGVLDIIHELDGQNSAHTKKTAKIGLEVCERMMETLNHILHIVSETHEAERASVSEQTLQGVFHSTSSGLEIFAARNSVRFATTFDCTPNALVKVDMNSVAHIFNNLCGNAIKFSGDNGEVNARINLLDSRESANELWASLSKRYESSFDATATRQLFGGAANLKWLVVQVEDNGCGISPDDMPNIFGKFTQVGDIVTKKFPGTGLGLHTTRTSVDDMHGFLSVASTPNKGTLFFCATPVEQLEQRRQAKAVSDGSTRHSAAVVSFLVVDDSRVNVMIVEKQVCRAFSNATIYTAADGEAALEELRKLREGGTRELCGIFMDYHMPVMSGLEATRRIRNARDRVPIAILTADITETSRQSLLASGADFVVLKPSRPADIVETCVKMIELKQGLEAGKLPPIVTIGINLVKL